MIRCEEARRQEGEKSDDDEETMDGNGEVSLDEPRYH